MQLLAFYDRNSWLFAFLTTACIVLALALMARNRQDGTVAVGLVREAPVEALEMPTPSVARELLVNAALPVDNDIARLPAKAAAPVEKRRVTAGMNVKIYTPISSVSEADPSTHPRVSTEDTVKVRVVTIRAKVTAYTAWDHRITKPEWADGLVAWRPNGRRRDVRTHPYGLATDWSQFPPGATFIRIPGYMDRSHPEFPANYWVVDDKCGAARKARRHGGQPIIDLRFVTRFSAVDRRHGWGARELDVEVIFPAGHELPESLRPWVVAAEWHTYHRGRLVERVGDPSTEAVMLAAAR